ncbi:trypsin-like peptidase domain-containing protein [Aliarcobacter butzleri]|uniref:S1C family serine protease n=1 Tax=Aliarcobacter butzleri TaxID=28197 RepID=UPI001260984D|nr:S1C family serine protease [Aliarcobacter butzleri]
MKKYIFIILFSIYSYASTIPTTSIVKVFTSASIPNYKFPWQGKKIEDFTGSGVIIKDNQILTSAHVVGYGKFIEIQKENDNKKYIAKIKYISNQVDLAILEVIDKEFFKNTKALKLSTNVKYRDNVTVIGYPIGGDSISTTNGVISRIEYKKYLWSKEDFLAIQIDAAINSGNSGGAAIDKNGDIIGIVIQGLKKADNIGYIVPSIVINNFLEDTKDNKIDGFSFTETKFSTLENQYQQEFYGTKNGILVIDTDIKDIELKENDILLAINGKKIFSDGNIDSQYGKTNFKLELHTKQIGNIVKLEILRDKNIIEVDYEVKYSKKIIPKEFDISSRYFIFGGFVFVPFSLNAVYEYGIDSDVMNHLYIKKKKDEYKAELVFLQPTIFSHKINRGYKALGNFVEKVNGINIVDFKHFMEFIDNTKDEYIQIEFQNKEKIILKTKEAKDSFEEIKNIYDLKNDRKI